MENKIKAIDPKIIVNRDVNRPYYSIEYYDTSDNKWHIGYGSYNLANVIEWLDREFDVVEADVIPIEENIEAIIPDNHEVAEVCPNCDNEITMIWDVAKRGLKVFCPVCGKRLMLCSECPATTERGAACDYDSKTDTCNVTRLNFRHDNGRGV